MKPESDSIQRERLLKIAIGETISGKTDVTPYDLMPPTVKANHKKPMSYVSGFFPKKRREK
jgi:hypothetical protein